MYKLYKFRTIQDISNFNRNVLNISANNINICGGLLLDTMVFDDKVKCQIAGSNKYFSMTRMDFNKMFMLNERNNLSGKYICSSATYRAKLNYTFEAEKLKVVSYNDHITISSLDSVNALLLTKNEFQIVFRRVGDTYTSEEPEISGFVKSINLEITSEEQRLNAIEMLKGIKIK